MTTTLKCEGCGVTYPSRYYFADFANGVLCTECALLTPEERERRRAVSTAEVRGSVDTGSAQEGTSVHPLAVSSLCVGAVSVFLFPTWSILAGLLAVGLGAMASREIAGSGGRIAGLRLARIGMILGCAMAGAWTLVIVVGRLVAAFR